jgi:hypothetical protein
MGAYGHHGGMVGRACKIGIYHRARWCLILKSITGVRILNKEGRKTWEHDFLDHWIKLSSWTESGGGALLPPVTRKLDCSPQPNENESDIARNTNLSHCGNKHCLIAQWKFNDLSIMNRYSENILSPAWPGFHPLGQGQSQVPNDREDAEVTDRTLGHWVAGGKLK